MSCPYSGPTGYHVAILRLLLRQPATIMRLVSITGYPARRVRGVITYLRACGAVYRERWFRRGHGGQWAVYRVRVVEL